MILSRARDLRLRDGAHGSRDCRARVPPVVSTSALLRGLRAAIGFANSEVDGVATAPFIVRLLSMPDAVDASVMTHRFGIYFPGSSGRSTHFCRRRWRNFESCWGYVGAAATKSVILGSGRGGDLGAAHPAAQRAPVWMIAFLS